MNSNELWKQNVCNISMNLRCEFGLCRWDWIWYFDIPNETFLGLILENRKLTRTNCGNRVSRSMNNLRCEFGLCRWDWIWYFDIPNSSYYCTICTPWKYWLHWKNHMIQRTRCKQTLFLSCQRISIGGGHQKDNSSWDEWLTIVVESWKWENSFVGYYAIEFSRAVTK